MKNKKGFTLTEILLAVMIVGIIGVALASLTTASSRESGVGRSRMVLRDNLSVALRQLRRDVQSSTRMLYARGPIASVSGTTAIPLLALGKGVTWGNEALPGQTASYITYCFVPGTQTKLVDGNTNVLPSGAKDGGTIYRRESSTMQWVGGNIAIPKCGNPATDSSFKVFLQNVKFLPSSSNYASPLFRIGFWNGEYLVSNSATNDNLGTQLMVNLVLEINSSPVVNDVTEEMFILPNSFAYKE